MRTELLVEAELADLDKAHDDFAAAQAAAELSVRRAGRARDRLEAHVLERVGARLGVPASSLQPLRDSQGIPLGVTFQEPAKPTPPSA